MNEQLVAAAVSALAVLVGAAAYYMRQLVRAAGGNPSLGEHLKRLERLNEEQLTQLRTMSTNLILANDRLLNIWEEVRNGKTRRT